MVDNIVSQMIKQHRGLQNDLGLVAEELKNKVFPAEKIINLLDTFKTDLSEHLHLENDVFYKDLLVKMKEKGHDTAKTEQFIDQMKEIEIVVLDFLNKYADEEIILKHQDDFTSEFNNLVDTLNLRIESEESGIYAYWGLF
ncbi:hypothetical protein C0581_02540 [Candidatus Parcubacteria bacterium]|nr:MAG: hypothetical protein C0581_02540 [Candidatus Parcubacteria bacterium]